jgi:hypothetical protein
MKLLKPGLGEMRWSGNSQPTPHPASLNTRRVKIGKPEWQFMDVLPATQENCYQHRSNTGRFPLI